MQVYLHQRRIFRYILYMLRIAQQHRFTLGQGKKRPWKTLPSAFNDMKTASRPTGAMHFDLSMTTSHCFSFHRYSLHCAGNKGGNSVISNFIIFQRIFYTQVFSSLSRKPKSIRSFQNHKVSTSVSDPDPVGSAFNLGLDPGSGSVIGIRIQMSKNKV
jgi:hypothetical protein